MTEEPTPDCCDRWRLAILCFTWMETGGDPPMVGMPHLYNWIDRTRHMINFCPFCGAAMRDVAVERGRVEG